MSLTYTIPEVAELIGVSRNTAYEQARTGEILGVPVLKVGRRLLVPRAPVERLLGLTHEDEEPAEKDGAA